MRFPQRPVINYQPVDPIGLGRFFDNIMAKLVFVSFLTSAAGFISSKFGFLDPDLSMWVDIVTYAIISLAILFVVINYFHEMRIVKRRIGNFAPK